MSERRRKKNRPGPAGPGYTKPQDNRPYKHAGIYEDEVTGEIILPDHLKEDGDDD